MLQVHTVVPFGVMGVAALVVTFTVTLLRQFGPPLCINQTPSEPVGVYRLVQHSPTDYRRGMYVIFPVPQHLQNLVYGRGWMRAGIPFLKEIIGLAGDRVCISATALQVNDHYIGPLFASDSHGLSLPQRPGCFVVPQNAFFAASQRLPNSFDGRYFGALPLAVLTGEARPVWTF